MSWLLPADNIGKLPYYKNVPPTPRKKSCAKNDAWNKYKGMYQPNVDNTTRPPTKDCPKDEYIRNGKVIKCRCKISSMHRFCDYCDTI